MDGRGIRARQRLDLLSIGLILGICAGIVRPGLHWLAASGVSTWALARNLERTRDQAGFARLREALDGDDAGTITAGARHATIGRAAVIMAAKGGTLAEIAAGDFLELLDAEREVHGRRRDYSAVSWRLLRQAGAFGPQAPESLAQLLTVGQRSPAELVDRYQLACRPVRDLLVDYLQERQPALDYRSLDTLAQHLARNFWADLERHHPGIAGLGLSSEVAAAWRQRTRTQPGDSGQRLGSRLPCCRSGPSTWIWPAGPPRIPPAGASGRSPAPSPRPTLRPARRRGGASLGWTAAPASASRFCRPWPARPTATGARTARTLNAALAVPPGSAFSVGGQSFTRPALLKAGTRTWALDSEGKRHDLTWEEDHAFWTWAIIEVLRATGIRAEELLELTHHSLIQYRLPTTGELVPLLQIAPSKTDTERLLVVSPDLADVLAAVITRLAGPDGRIPLTARYDGHEKVWQPPAPLLFQRRGGTELRAISTGTVRNMLNAALGRTGLTDVAGQPLVFTPHDFRRMFITDAIMTGLPPHIAQVIAGHRNINVTMGYKAAYPEEVITHHQAFIARRRSLRPTEEYRTPTDEEWEEFLGHFERRKLSVGNCGRAFATPCIHEHACVRCPMLWPDPAQRPRLAEIRDNLTARIAEAEREGWLGDIEGLQVSLTGANDKLAQIDRRSGARQPVDLGFPVIPPQRQPEKQMPISP